MNPLWEPITPKEAINQYENTPNDNKNNSNNYVTLKPKYFP